MKIPFFDYSVAPQVDAVVAMGGGPSSVKNDKLIRAFIKDEKSKIFAANYVYPIKPDYIYFGDFGVFRAQRKNAVVNKCDIIVSSTMIKRFSKNFWLKVIKKGQFYIIFSPKSKRSKKANFASKWRITKNGRFPYSKITPSGLATIAISLLCRPKKILLTGMDGPFHFKRGKVWKKNFKGKTKMYGNIKKYRTRKNELEKLVLPFLLRKKVEIYCPDNSAFWGIDKKKFNIHTLG